MSLLFVLHKRPIDIRVHDQAFQVVLREQLRIFAPAERRNLPSRLAIVGLHLGEALDDQFFSNLVGALVFLAKFRAKGTLAELCAGADAAHGLQLVESAMRLNILGDDLINSLCAGGNGKEHDGRRYGKKKTDNPGELPQWSQPQIYFHELPPPNPTISDITSNGRHR